MIAGAAAGAAQRIDRIGARREPRRRGAEQDAGDEREAERECQHHRRRTRVDRQEGRAGEGERKQQARGANGDDEAGDAAGDREQDALDERLGDDLPPRRAHREPDRRLTAPRDRAGEQQVRDVGAGDEQHQPAHAEENLQAASVLLPHDADAGAGGNDRDDLLGQSLDDVGHPVGRVAGVVLHPLAEDAGEPRAHAVCRRIRTQPADHAQPRGDGLAEDRGVAVDERLLLERNPQIGRVAPQRFAEESRRRDADRGERVPLDEERAADNRRIAAVGALPDVMAQHHGRRRRRRVVRSGEDAAAERADA